MKHVALACLALSAALPPARAHVWTIDLQGQAGFGLLSGNETTGLSGSPGRGGEIGAGITFDDATNTLTLNLGWGSGNGFVNLTGNANAAHIHGPTAADAPASFTQAAGVLIGLTSSPFTFNNSASAGGITGSTVLSVANATALFAGRLYVNVHTAANGGGEIRGNLVPAAGNFRVANTANTGAGSLRQAIANAAVAPGAQTITFDPDLAGQTISTGGMQHVLPSETITIDALNLAGGIVLDGAGTGRIVQVPAGGNATFKGLTFTNGFANALAIEPIGTPAASLGVDQDTLAYTLAAGNERALVVVASHAAEDNITGVSFGGLALTQVVEWGDGIAVDSLWVRAMGSSALSTTANIVVTRSSSASDQQFIAAAAYAQVDQANPMNGGQAANLTTGGNVGSTLTINSTEGDLVFDVFDVFNATPAPTSTPGGGQIVRHNRIATVSFGSVLYTTTTKPGVFPSVPMSWTSTGTDMIHIAANLRHSSSASVGGAVHNQGTALLDGCRLLGNSAALGGAVHNEGILEIRGSSLEDNTATGTGGGVYSTGALNLNTSRLFRNKATEIDGGGLYAINTARVENCTFAYNQAFDKGGAMSLDLNADVNNRVLQCTLVGNSSTAGPAISKFGANGLPVRQCTIVENMGIEGKGGVACIGIYAGTLTLGNSLVGATSTHPDIYVEPGAALVAEGRNFIGDNTGVASIFPAGGLIGIAANERYHGLLPLGFYGGAVETMPPATLSPARNNGVADGNTPAADARGFPRVVDGTPDLGAAEEVATYTAPHAANGSYNVYMVLPGHRTWSAAVASAPVFNGVTGHLVAVQTADENEFVHRIAGRSYCWIGLTDNEAFGGAEAGSNGTAAGWVWQGGIPGTFRNWAGGEPNETSPGEDAVTMYPDGRWYDAGMGANGQANVTAFSSVYEFEIQSPVPVTGLTAPQPWLPPYPVVVGCGGAEGAFLGQERTGLISPSHLSEAGRAVNNAVGYGLQTDVSVARINHADPENAGGGGAFIGDVAFQTNTAGDDSNFAGYYRGHLRILPAQAGWWTFQLRSDDGCALRIVGGEWAQAAGSGSVDPGDASVLGFPTPTADSYTFGAIYLNPGEHDLEFIAYELGGGAYWELSAAPGIFPPAGDYKLVGDPAGLVLTGSPSYLAFNGSSDYLEISGTGVALGNAFTEEAWIYPQHTDSGYHGFLGNQPAGGTFARSPSMWVNAGRRLHGGFGTGSAWTPWDTGDVLTTNAWNHVAATYDGVNYRVYVNANLVLTQAHAVSAVNTPVKWIGRVDNFFKGRMDEVRLWTVARTQGQIQADMHRTLSGAEPGLAAYWRFDVCNSLTPPSIGPALTLDPFGSLTSGSGWIPAPAPVRTEPLTVVPLGNALLGFTGMPGAAYSVLASPEVTLPFIQWTRLGPAQETSPGEFSFSDPAAATQPRRYYQIRSE